MGMHLAEALNASKQILGEERGRLLDYLADCRAANLAWYLDRKILGVEEAERYDNGRLFKYAFNFCRTGGKVTFLRESTAAGAKMPDLRIDKEGFEFFVEVKMFRLASPGTTDPVSKITHAVSQGRKQLPASQIGFVAIDNFDLALEGDDSAGLIDGHFMGALCELHRRAAENPGGWDRPGGVILSASTGSRVNPGEVYDFTDFIWVNQQSRPSVPEQLAEYVSSSLPNGRVFDSNSECAEDA